MLQDAYPSPKINSVMMSHGEGICAIIMSDARWTYIDP